MGASLFRTARGQASLALAGVLIIACAAAYEAYLGARDIEHSRAALSLVEQQRSLAHDLGEGALEESLHARLDRLAAADRTLEQLSATARHSDLGDNGILLAAVHNAWGMFRTEVTGSMALTANDAGAARRLAITRSHLDRQLDQLTAAYERRAVAMLHADAMIQAITLAAAVPLLTWAIVALLRGRPQEAAATLEDGAPDEPCNGLAARGGQGHPQPAHPPRLAGSPALVMDTPMRSVASSLRAPRGAPCLAQELRLYAADFRQLTGLQVDLVIDERAAESIPAALKPQALNIAREAMSSAGSQARATRVSVSLWIDAGSVWLAVSDNGATAGGSTVAGAESAGLALLRARAERIGGELLVNAEPGEGTLIMARLPMLDPGGEPLSGRITGAPRRAW